MVIEYFGIKKDNTKFNDSLKTKSTRYNKIRKEILSKLNLKEDDLYELNFNIIE